MTNKQIEGVIKLFALNFVRCESAEERKNIFVQFEDTFSKEIVDWEIKCKEMIGHFTADELLLKEFDKFNCDNKYSVDEVVKIREFEKGDISQVRELLNRAFALSITYLDDDKFGKFIESGCSFVAYSDEVVVGVALAYFMPSLNKTTIFLDNFAVVEGMRGKGIGKRLLNAIKKSGPKQNLICIKLKTDKKMNAFEIYKHWGFMEDELTSMTLYTASW